MSYPISPEERELAEGLVFARSSDGLAQEANELLDNAGLVRPLELEEVDRIAWASGYYLSEAAPWYVKAVAVDLSSRLAVRFSKNLGRASIESNDLVTATNCAEFLGGVSLQGKFESFFLKSLIRDYGQLCIDYELRQIRDQDD